MPKMVRFEDVEWEDAPKGYYLTDVKWKRLWVDQKTGATLVLIKFPPGISDKMHSHPEANQITYGLKGEIRTPMGVITPDGTSVNIVPKGEVHGRGDFLSETIALFYWDGPPKPKVKE